MKKAITPLISTIILLSFAIGLGVMVMSWGNSGKFNPEHSCADKRISFTEIGNSKMICMQNNEINALIQNDGKKEISNIKIILITKEGSIIKEMTEPFTSGESKKITVNVNELFGNKLLKFRAIPDNCIDSKIETELIGECQ